MWWQDTLQALAWQATIKHVSHTSGVGVCNFHGSGEHNDPEIHFRTVVWIPKQRGICQWHAWRRTSSSRNSTHRETDKEGNDRQHHFVRHGSSQTGAGHQMDQRPELNQLCFRQCHSAKQGYRGRESIRTMLTCNMPQRRQHALRSRMRTNHKRTLPRQDRNENSGSRPRGQNDLNAETV